MGTKRILLFASGSGSNVENIYNYIVKHRLDIEVVGVLCNKESAGIFDRCERLGLPISLFDRATFRDSDKFLTLINGYQADLIVLAGFLWLIPSFLVEAYPNQIINIHPALLPKYGGKGMYGMNVHESVVKNQEIETGITIHYVNEAYDEGATICQAKVAVDENDTPESVAEKVHQLEYKHFPEVIEKLLLQ